MDLTTVTRIRAPRTRDELRLAPGEGFLAGGSALFAEPTTLTGLVDLTAMGWPAETASESGLTVAATCSIAELLAVPSREDWPALHLIRRCAESLYMSFKVWPQATVGGNIATALPAGAMTSLAASLDARILVWRADGTDERVPATAFVTGNQTTVLSDGDVLRAIEFDAEILRQHTAFRQTSLSPVGRTATLLIGRIDPERGLVLTITGGTEHPEQFAYIEPPSPDVLAADFARVDSWFTDPHGEADWRRHVSTLLAVEIVTELTEASWT